MGWASKKRGDKTVRFPRSNVGDIPESYTCALCGYVKYGQPFLLEGEPLCKECQAEYESKEYQTFQAEEEAKEKVDSRPVEAQAADRVLDFFRE